ncbi:Dihydrofolate reductase [Sulfitobacter indolifex]|uniref:Dihydrofolate reductase n=1 Tax=Sulfitobacter indolifex HEL-45 TaxID=391624 RepID=A0ABP2DBL3_9RHOB|nr:dihydrofolate reductase [Sulfitobacter indolifex]EDQ05153.1 Dihydrofolate reductase [Sulfitobacter indolifex HEL-45]UOA18201.1 Dihydrofolate reductase [Sulfitobacter indolifex]
MLSLIVARARNGAIGKDGDIPWSLPEDLKFFQRETTGGAIIMGRRTWESLPFKPLKNRLNCVVSSADIDGVHVARDPQAALGYCAAEGYRRVYGIGGEGIYRALLPLADRLLVTEVDVEIDGADAFFPDFDPNEWIELGNLCLRPEGPRAIAREWLRRS